MNPIITRNPTQSPTPAPTLLTLVDNELVYAYSSVETIAATEAQQWCQDNLVNGNLVTILSSGVQQRIQDLLVKVCLIFKKR